MKMILPEATKNEYLIEPPLNLNKWVFNSKRPLSKNEYLIQNPPSRFK